jgi:hypothetical protein
MALPALNTRITRTARNDRRAPASAKLPSKLIAIVGGMSTSRRSIQLRRTKGQRADVRQNRVMNSAANKAQTPRSTHANGPAHGDSGLILSWATIKGMMLTDRASIGHAVCFSKRSSASSDRVKWFPQGDKVAFPTSIDRIARRAYFIGEAEGIGTKPGRPPKSDEGIIRSRQDVSPRQPLGYGPLNLPIQALAAP